MLGRIGRVHWNVAPKRVIAPFAGPNREVNILMSQVVWECNLNWWYIPSKAKYRLETDSIQVP